MELSFARCDQILKTLPIGYYTGRRIEVSLDKTTGTSFYSPIEDKIVVSYSIIAERCKNLSESVDEEGAVRAMLYHEVSHAILTPMKLENTNIVNIFEDERIETILQGYYQNVDFKQQLYDLHEGKVPAPKDAIQAFFNAVRFRVGPQDILEQIDNCINRYDFLNRSANWNTVRAYRYDIEAIYNQIAEEFEKQPKQFKEKGQGQPQQDRGEKTMVQESNKKAGLFIDKQQIEHIKDIMKHSLNKNPGLSSDETQRVNEFQKTIEMIIKNFNKKNSGGAGINTYSGVFNPRACARQDYKYFEHSMSIQGNNKFGTCHLNLIIDCSGSFEKNVPLTNGILAALTTIEKKNCNFSMDVAFINNSVTLCKTIRERSMTAWGGNDIPADMKDILLRMQRPNTCNYNIILFDGDALSNNYHLNEEEKARRFSAFDMKQTTLISDYENQYYAKDFRTTKVIFTRNYTSELINHITKAMGFAFN